MDGNSDWEAIRQYGDITLPKEEQLSSASKCSDSSSVLIMKQRADLAAAEKKIEFAEREQKIKMQLYNLNFKRKDLNLKRKEQLLLLDCHQ